MGMASVKILKCTTPQGDAGLLAKESQFHWRYDSTALETAISLAMPPRLSSFASNTVHSIFAMNLPEGEQYFRIRSRFAKEFPKLNEMALLSIVGNNQIGRLSLHGANQVRSRSQLRIGLSELKSSTASKELFEALFDSYFAAGISGAQPKITVPDADRGNNADRQNLATFDLIVKTGGDEYPHLSRNEFVCMSVAQKAGVECSDFHLNQDGELFITSRFDVDADQSKMGFEDMAALSLSTYDSIGNYKYRGNYEGVAKIINNFCTASKTASLQRFFEQLVLSVIVRNGDAHLKNFGLLYVDPSKPESVRLSPVFDVVCTNVYEHEINGRMHTDNTLALKLAGNKSYPSRNALIRFGQEHCSVARPEEVLERISEASWEVMNEYQGLFPREFGQKLDCAWEAGRQSVAPDRVYLAPAEPPAAPT